jgi:enoyl-CoA hydratase/carnithine racemase
MSAELVVERRGPATHLIINRPERGNALDALLVEQLHVALKLAATDGTRLVVLRGNGRNFCTGFDLTSVDSESGGDLALRFVRIEQVLQLLYHYPVDTIAFARGRTYGAGADLFCACRHRVCADKASFRFPGVRFGVVLGTRRLAARVGSDVAATILLEGRELSAAEALDAGLATAQLPETEWDGMTEKLVQATKAIAPPTTEVVLSALRPDTRDSDMASLVASVAEPEFKSRVCAYRDRAAKGS